ncbi:hypothetical protein ACWEQ3_50100, partial [Streptomyces mirabilis]
ITKNLSTAGSGNPGIGGGIGSIGGGTSGIGGGGTGSPSPFTKNLSTAGSGNPGIGGGIGSIGGGTSGIGGGTGGIGGGGTGSPSPFTKNLSTAGSGNPGIGGGAGLNAAAMDAALNPSGSVGSGTEGSANIPGLGYLASPVGFGGNTSTDGTGQLAKGLNLKSSLPSTWGDTTATGFPGSTSTGAASNVTTPGIGSDLSVGGVGTGKVTGFPGSISTQSGLPSTVGGLSSSTGSGLGSSLVSPGTGAGAGGASAFPGGTTVGAGNGTGTGAAGMPMMPGMGGAAGAGTPQAERSDASGLLSNSNEPWTGDTTVDHADVGSHLGTTAGGAGLDLPTTTTGVVDSNPGTTVGAGNGTGTGAAGMPMMPGMGGAAGAGTPQAERSDASGLLSNSNEPWTGDTTVDHADVGSHLGTTAGGAGLDLPTTTTGVVDSNGNPVPSGTDASAFATGSVGNGVAEAVVVRGIPGMGMPPTAGIEAGAGRSGERSDASSLLSGGQSDWTGAPHPPEEFGEMAGGVASGEAIFDGAPATGARVPGATGESQATADLAGDRVAVVRPPGPEVAEDTAAWDTGGGSFAALLWPVFGDHGDGEGHEVGATGYASADAGTWGETGSLREAHTGSGDAAAADPGLVAWRPDRRTGTATAGTYLSGVNAEAMQCGDAPFNPNQEDEASAADERGSTGEETTGKAVADLLVQDGSVWGALPRGSGGVG